MPYYTIHKEQKSTEYSTPEQAIKSLMSTIQETEGKTKTKLVHYKIFENTNGEISLHKEDHVKITPKEVDCILDKETEESLPHEWGEPYIRNYGSRRIATRVCNVCHSGMSTEDTVKCEECGKEEPDNISYIEGYK